MTPTLRRSPLAIAGVLAVGLIARSSAQQTAAPPAAPAAGQMVTVDFSAVSDDGRPILDLKAEDISLRIDGRARAVHSFDLVQVAGAHSGHEANLPAAAPPAFSTNALSESGRTVLLVVDDESIAPGMERPMQQSITQFLSALSPHDQVALITVPHGGMKVDLTTNLDKVRQALPLVVGQAPQSESITDAACRTRSDLEQLTGILESLSGGQSPVTVIFFTASMTGSRMAITMAASGRGGVSAIARCELQPDEFEHVGVAASAARAQFYIMRPDNGSGSTSAPTTPTRTGAGSNNVRGTDSLIEGIANLAGVTGGVQMPLAGAGDNNMIRVAIETSAYYAVTFDADPQERNGLPHKVDVHVNRPSVAVHSLPTVVIASHATPADAPSARAIISDMKPFRDLGLRATSFSARHQGDSLLKVVAIFEPQDPLAKLSSAMAGLFDDAGHMVKQWTATPEELAKTPTFSLLAQAGHYRLRIAATDTSGRSGATDSTVDLRLTPAGPLNVSSLALGLNRNGTFAPRFEFKDEPVAIAFFEIYGGQEKMPVTVYLELLKNEGGPALITQPAAVDATQDADRFVVESALPIGMLPAGDYVVRAHVSVGDNPQVATVSRTLHKASQ